MKSKSLKYLIGVCLLVVNPLLFNAQTNADFKKFSIADQKTVRSGMDISPDGKHLAIAGRKNFPLFIYDWKNDKIIKKFDVGNWNVGAKVKYSKKGTYLLLQRLYYFSKGKAVDFEIVNAETGKIIKKANNIRDLKIASDETYYMTLTKEGITKYALPSGEKLAQFTIENATNAIAISPDGKHIAVSHKPTFEQVKNSPTIRNDKKAKKVIKEALKSREMISVYDAKTVKKITTINELYEAVYTLQFNRDGSKLYNYMAPTSVSSIETTSWTALRTSYFSSYPYEPSFIETKDHNVFGIVSYDKQFPQINLHDSKTGRFKEVFNTNQRIWQGIKNGQNGDGMASFAFLPNGSIFIVTGNYGIIWTPELDL